MYVEMYASLCVGYKNTMYAFLCQGVKDISFMYLFIFLVMRYVQYCLTQ